LALCWNNFLSEVAAFEAGGELGLTPASLSIGAGITYQSEPLFNLYDILSGLSDGINSGAINNESEIAASIGYIFCEMTNEAFNPE